MGQGHLEDASGGPGDQWSAGKESGHGIRDTGFRLIPRTEPRGFADVLVGEQERIGAPPRSVISPKLRW